MSYLYIKNNIISFEIGQKNPNYVRSDSTSLADHTKITSLVDLLNIYQEELSNSTDSNSSQQGILNCDYDVFRTIVKTQVDEQGGFASLTSQEKEVAAFFCTEDDATLVTFYAADSNSSTFGNLQASTTKHLDVFAEHLAKQRIVAERRLRSKKLVIALMTFLKDRNEIDIFTDATRDFQFDYQMKFHKGTNYGDYRDGMMDYVESTGGYSNTGLKSYEYNDSLVQSYLDANAVDPLNPTQLELDSARDNYRLILASQIKDVLIYGKLQ